MIYLLITIVLLVYFIILSSSIILDFLVSTCYYGGRTKNVEREEKAMREKLEKLLGKGFCSGCCGDDGDKAPTGETLQLLEKLYQLLHKTHPQLPGATVTALRRTWGPGSPEDDRFPVWVEEPYQGVPRVRFSGCCFRAKDIIEAAWTEYQWLPPPQKSQSGTA